MRHKYMAMAMQTMELRTRRQLLLKCPFLTGEVAVAGVGFEELRGGRNVAELLQTADGGQTGDGDVKTIRRHQLVQVQITSDLLHDRFHLVKEEVTGVGR